MSSSCTDKSTPPDPKDLTWNGAYDWRYSGKRPQESEHGKLWPVIAAHIEAKVEKADGKKVVIYAHSGGTITAYAFLMSQTPAWRKANVLAFMPVVPVFGGTLISLQSILTGWDSYGNHPHSFSSISVRLICVAVYTRARWWWTWQLWVLASIARRSRSSNISGASRISAGSDLTADDCGCLFLSGLDKCIGRQAALRLPSLLWMWPRLGKAGDKWLWDDKEVRSYPDLVAKS